MKARLTIDVDGSFEVALFPETTAERLMLHKMAEATTFKAKASYDSRNYYLSEAERLIAFKLTPHADDPA